MQKGHNGHFYSSWKLTVQGERYVYLKEKLTWDSSFTSHIEFHFDYV